MFSYEHYGISLNIPINTFVEHVRELKHKEAFTCMAQVYENAKFFTKVSREIGYPLLELMEFAFFAGCPAIKIKVSEPFLIYE